jgi:hypothetical protein
MKKLILCIALFSFITVTYAQENKITPAAGEVEITYIRKGTQLGVWNPKTQVYTLTAVYAEGPFAGQHQSLTFTEEGKVVTKDGTLMGIKQKDGSWKSNSTKNVIRSSYLVLWNDEVVGNILDTQVSIHGTPMVRISAPMDQDVLTFLVFCFHWGGDQINQIKQTANKKKNQQSTETKPRFRKGLTADRIDISGSEVYAYSNNKRIGRARLEGEKIYVYSGGNTGPNGCIKAANVVTDYRGESEIYGSASIDFLGAINAYEFFQKNDNCTFYGERHVTLGEVKPYGSQYAVYDAKGRSLGKFPDSLDPRFGALFFYEFFDQN